MTQAVRAGWLEHTHFETSVFERSLQNRFMEMMPALFSRRSVGVMACLGGNKGNMLLFCAPVRLDAVGGYGSTDWVDRCLGGDVPARMN